EFQEKYKVKVLFFYDYGYRHFWTNKSPIIEPKDLRGRKIRVQLAKVFSDTIAGLGGNAVPMAWGEVVTAAKQGVIDGGDLPIVNIDALRIYEVAKFCSMTFHNYGPTLIVMNLEMFQNLSAEHKKLLLDLGREAQDRVRHATESVDNFESAKKLLEPKGMTVVEAKVEEFRRSRRRKFGLSTRASLAHCGTRSQASRVDASAGRRFGSAPRTPRVRPADAVRGLIPCCGSSPRSQGWPSPP